MSSAAPGILAYFVDNEQVFFQYYVAGWLAMAAFLLVVLVFVTAPHGKHASSGWGPELPDQRLGWVLMEAPAPLLATYFYTLSAPEQRTLTTKVFFAMFMLHYVHRAFIYPLNMRGKKSMPVLIMLSALCFNLCSGYLNGRSLFHFAPARDDAYLTSPQFLVGLALFAIGMFVNIQSDYILLNLRKPGETGYKIPHGGLYEYVSAPNYAGECLEWLGYALATWYPLFPIDSFGGILSWASPGLAFALMIIVTIAPRGYKSHQWYLAKFKEDYPAQRKALIPYLL